MYLKEGLTAYTGYLKQKNFTGRTIESYMERIKVFLRYLYRIGIKRIREITESHISAYLSERYYHINELGRQNTVRTRSYERYTLKKFLGYLYAYGYLSEEHSIPSITPKRITIPKDILSKRELIRILGLPDTHTLSGYRDRMIFELLIATGIRHYELIRLCVEDIDFDDRSIRINQGKGKKDRVVPVNETALNYIKGYIDEIRPKFANPKTPDTRLILSVYGKPFGSRNLNQVLRPYLRKIRKKNLSIHSFRRTYATHLIQAGCPLRHVQELMGHADLNTTVKYVELNMKDLQKEYRKTHPAELDDTS